MTVRVIFCCSRCGSKSFRASTLRTFSDTWLLKIGVEAQRCYGCRRRFHLFRPALLRAALKALEGLPPEAASGQYAAAPAQASGHDILWSPVPNVDRGERVG